MKEVLGIFKNVKRGPITTAVGCVFMAFGGFMMYQVGFDKVEFNSVSFGIVAIGAWLLVSKDPKND